MSNYSYKREDLKSTKEDQNTPKPQEIKNPADVLASRLKPNNSSVGFTSQDLIDMGLDTNNKLVGIFSNNKNISNIGDIFKSFKDRNGVDLPLHKALGLDLSKLPTDIII